MVHLEKFGFDWDDTSPEFKYSVEFVDLFCLFC